MNITLFLHLIILFIAAEGAVAAGVAKSPNSLVFLIFILFWHFVLRCPVFPYPNQKVTWPWKK